MPHGGLIRLMQSANSGSGKAPRLECDVTRKLTYPNVVQALVDEVPGLRPLLREHLQDNDEVLAHVVFGDLTRFVQETALQRGANSPVVANILNFLEDAMSSEDEKVRELVSVSFLENLDHDIPAYAEIRAMLGPS